MAGLPQIKKFLGTRKIYGHDDRVVVEMLTTHREKGKDFDTFTTYETTVGKDEAELLKHLMFNLKNKLSNKELDRLWALIDKFGDERYYEGSNDEAMSNAGPEL